MSHHILQAPSLETLPKTVIAEAMHSAKGLGVDLVQSLHFKKGNPKHRKEILLDRFLWRI